jgi:hypothetical protein
MKRGILFVVFGDEYDKIASACTRITRQNTDLPIHILQEEIRRERWEGIDGLTFTVFDGAFQKDNRFIKLAMNFHSPFDQTLYLDCDSLVQPPFRGREDWLFGLLDEYDVVLNEFYFWDRGDKVLHLYQEAMHITGCRPPISIYNGAFVLFKKNERSEDFFDTWMEFWEMFSLRREMPPLACAAQKTKAKIGKLPPGFFSPEELRLRAAVQHDTGKVFREHYKLPFHQCSIPKTYTTDFHWEEWDEL